MDESEELFFAGCNGFGTIYLMHADGTDEFVAGSTRFSLLLYTPDDFFGLDLNANGPYYKVARFLRRIGTHRFELNVGNNKSSCIQGYVAKTRAEACSKLSTALSDALCAEGASPC